MPPSARLLNSRGTPFGWSDLLWTWLFRDRLRAQWKQDTPGSAAWPFEAIVHGSPFRLPKVLESAARRNLEHLGLAPREASRTPPLPPGNASTAPRRLLRRLTRKGNWQVERLVSDPLRFGTVRTEPMLPRHGVLRADPFSLRVLDRNWLLFEEQLPGDRGRLRSAVQTGAGWEVRDGEILPLPHHLSWPFVLEMEGRIFLLPESGEAGEVALWECEEFPRRWKKSKVLLRGRPWHDPCLVQHAGLWWLFASPGGSCPQDHSSELDAFFSPDPLRIPFEPHALNPLSLSVAGSRPAGKFFVRDGVLHRPAQDCRGGYGTAILIQRVDSLTPWEFATTTLGRLDPPPGAHGFHTLNSLAGGGWVVDVFRG